MFLCLTNYVFDIVLRHIFSFINFIKKPWFPGKHQWATRRLYFELLDALKVMVPEYEQADLDINLIGQKFKKRTYI